MINFAIYAKHLRRQNNFINPLENYDIIYVKRNNTKKLKELMILKERYKGLKNLMNTKINFDNEIMLQ